ncbi:SufD family Fe-S cluster assembly protein [Fibrobacter sp. UWR2]|uniref:SufB/SufD family protein n=1 Tax=Fibrobacter sp. UWR2 TaxID=1964352 RepID=UPI000B5202D7|nr:SufD family Fe-S cluster assembly protein [Fibrobacter sp. UWR2]OWV02123.1 SufBD protein [Fibrobacter sp. UWR2]
MDALSRIKQLGMPRRNDELWTFFPIAKIPAPEFPDACTCDEDFSQETDFAALLPIAQNARPMVRDIPDGANEMALIKCNNDFGHTVLNIGKGAKASIEILDNKVLHALDAERFDINVGEGADVEIFFANPANDLPLRFRHFRISQAAKSTVRFSAIERGNGISRVSIDTFLNAEGANFEIRTLNVLSGNAESHHRLHIYHNAPETTSTQLSRNLLDGSSRASYDGSVIVGNGCTKANSSQLVNTILLSEDSSVSVKPVLKIYHDDVECTHGNTVGELDAEQMFYLVSRGIPQETAKKMLISSFAKETFYPLPDSPAKKRLLQNIQ